MSGVLENGSDVDRYVVEGEIGRGGMAVVYRVRHRQLGTRHALKVVVIPDMYVQWRLLQEGRVQAALRHPNIVAVHDVIDVAGSPGLLLELIEGPTLEQVRGDGMAAETAEALFRGILAGVGFAHAHGLVHRDLKPGNVLLARDGAGWIPKVTDFGLAKVLREHTWTEETRTRTRSNVAMGTPDYMAPEQARDARNVDARADVFALGCLFYELLCGRPPFEGPDMLTILNQVVAGVYAPPEDRVPNLSPRISAAIRGCLQVDRDLRLPDCEAVLAFLEGREPSPRTSAASFPSPPPALLDTPPPMLPSTGVQAQVAWPTPPASRSPFLRVAIGAGTIVGLCLIAVTAAWLASWLGAAPPRPVVSSPAARAVATSSPEEDEVSEDPGVAGVAGATGATVEPAVPAEPEVGPPRRRRIGAPAGSAGTAVLVVGDASSVALVNGSMRYAPGAVPAGRYAVEARFNNSDPVTAGVVTVREGESVTIRCVAEFAQCR